MVDTSARSRAGALQIPRSRGAASGLLIIVLGMWGALAPFIGPYFNFAFSPDQAWTWTAGRGWLEVLPGAVAVVGGLLMLASRNRATAMMGTWMAIAAGAWFVIGRALAGQLSLGEVGAPLATSEAQRVWLELTYFYGLGALIVFLGALALGRLSVRSARDIAYAENNAYAEKHAAESGASSTGGTAHGHRSRKTSLRDRLSSLFGRHHHGATTG